ncbi:hypothetical protein [Streptomyces sp. NPDC005969]|uniref:hypothetical protein n=1 Tax=Streptomyces sp. NPDC005969 TaxID=3156722 RepID=UPI0033DA4CAB
MPLQPLAQVVTLEQHARLDETTARGGAWTAGDRSVCGTCHADDVARKEAAAEVARLPAAAPPEPEGDQEPDRGRGWFRRRP